MEHSTRGASEPATRLKLRSLVLLIACFTICFPASPKPIKKSKSVVESEKLWKDPSGARDLFYGPGGKDHQPAGKRFKFVAEDLDGTNPKYNVLDESGVKWKIKLGPEAKPETAASRLVWAAGYFANEDYFLDELRMDGVPAQLHRGRNLVARDGTVHDARLKRHLKGEEKIGTWKWRDDPFTGSREWNGLRVLMALLNNWDLKDENNAVFEDKARPERMYLVSDLGASFGANGYNPDTSLSKGNLRSYQRSNFILKTTPEYVDFAIPSRPAMIMVFYPPGFFQRMNLRWIGKRVPRDDARWVGRILARLSSAQIGDAFRASGFSPGEVAGFSAVVEKRIRELNAL